jgi:hypothetical protein
MHAWLLNTWRAFATDEEERVPGDAGRGMNHNQNNMLRKMTICRVMMLYDPTSMTPYGSMSE